MLAILASLIEIRTKEPKKPVIFMVINSKNEIVIAVLTGKGQ